jgi:type I restriction-modification system DNA methylase subunit
MVHALTRNEPEYIKMVGRMKKEAVNVSVQIYAMLMKALYHDFVIYDILGNVYMNVASMSKSQALGQYFTPFPVCEMMAKMSLGDIKAQIETAKAEGKRLKVCDPAVGSGAMLLASKKVIIEEMGLRGLDYFEFYGIDIDPICVNMCKIQMILTDYKYMSNLMITTAYEMREKMKSAKP